MNRLFYLFLFVATLFTATNTWAQPKNPVKWTIEANLIDGNEYEIVMTAKIDDGWNTYSPFTDDAGPVPTSLKFETPNVQLNGKIVESTSSPDNRKEGKDPLFDGVTVIKYKKDLKLVQKIRVEDPSKPLVGYVESMACDSETCTPPTATEFSLTLSTKKASANPVKWTFQIKPISGNEYEFVMTGKIDDTWSTYSPYTDDAGPVPTSLNFETPENVELIGKIVESTSSPDNRKEGKDPLFDGVTVIKYKKDLTLVQKIRVKDTTKPLVGYIESMACDAATCTPPTATEFKLSLTGENLDTTNTPVKSTISKDLERTVIKESMAALGTGGGCGVDAEATTTVGMSLWMIFMFGFLGGLFALLTPCVFPMVPLTVSYFTKRSKSRAEGIRNASIYSLSIIFIYVALGLVVTLAFGADALNALSTHWLPNTIFFVLFVAFAISFFGYYDIKLPSSWTNKTDAAADKGGLIGIFFMAFTLALVSFSCTGPIIGTLLVEASSGGNISGPLFGMTGFAVALALPFGLFSLFPTMLNALPRSGGWMTTVKVVLGFIELALAFKFLSKADLTQHWGILKYETFMVAVTACAVGMGAYLFGFIKFPHDDHKWGRTTVAGYITGALSFALAGYIATGFTVNDKTHTYNTPAFLSGIVPPACYSYFHPCDCPAGIQVCFKDYYEGVKYAQASQKPILLDFTGHACENCRKMEDQVWTDPQVNKLINENYVLISLYVDDRKTLPEVLTTADNRKLRTVGNLWAEFEMVNFASQAQPLYILLAPDEKVLHLPIGATLGAGGTEKYIKFLQCGLQKK
jgi:thiol:disulfide interchange protein